MAVPKHRERPVQVTAWVDEGVAELVEALNGIPGVSTLVHSCECDGPSMGQARVIFHFREDPDRRFDPVDHVVLLWQLVEQFDAYPKIRSCGFTLGFEWLGSDDFPRAHLYAPAENMPLIAEAIRQYAQRAHGVPVS